MTIRTLRFSQFLPRPRAEIFPFFAAAENLERITPPWLHFRILTPTPVAMQRGALIDYRIRLHGLPLRWRTEIAEWEPPFRFVDSQLRGPYRLWVHTHTFTEVPGGTQCDDEVRYAVPGGPLIDTLFVRGQVERIFAHRQKTLHELFCRETPIFGGAQTRADLLPTAKVSPKAPHRSRAAIGNAPAQ